MPHIRFPPSLRNVEDRRHGRGIDVSHEAVRYWWSRFGPVFAAGNGPNACVPGRKGAGNWTRVFVQIEGHTLSLACRRLSTAVGAAGRFRRTYGGAPQGHLPFLVFGRGQDKKAQILVP